MTYVQQKVLIVDDDSSVCDFLKNLFTQDSWETTTQNNPLHAIHWLEKNETDLVILDLKMSNMDGIKALERIKKLNNNIQVIMITGYGTIRLAVEAMKKGAYDFITKPFEDIQQILKLARQAVNEIKNHEANSYLFDIINSEPTLNSFIGKSPKIRKIYQIINKIAPLDSTVLITGDTGTGKELVARLIHDKSPRRNYKFVAVNACALPGELIESTLFGYERGAFTGAYKTNIGLFEEARKGTLFLDEIGDTSPSLQVKLLRILQEKEYQRVGGTKTLKADVRLVASSNKNLFEEVQKGNFREDLYFRLNVIHIELPRLEEHREDIQLLANFYIKKFTKQYKKQIDGFTPEVIKCFNNYHWPGNVRELVNVVEYAVGICDGNQISRNHLPEYLNGVKIINLGDPNKKLDLLLEDYEKQLLIKVLKSTKGNVTRTAKLTGLSRQNLYYRLKKYHQNPADYKS